MPYSIRTENNIQIDNIPDDIRPDSEEFLSLIEPYVTKASSKKSKWESFKSELKDVAQRDVEALKKAPGSLVPGLIKATKEAGQGVLTAALHPGETLSNINDTVSGMLGIGAEALTPYRKEVKGNLTDKQRKLGELGMSQAKSYLPWTPEFADRLGNESGSYLLDVLPFLVGKAGKVGKAASFVESAAAPERMLTPVLNAGSKVKSFLRPYAHPVEGLLMEASEGDPAKLASMLENADPEIIKGLPIPPELRVANIDKSPVMFQRLMRDVRDFNGTKAFDEASQALKDRQDRIFFKGSADDIAAMEAERRKLTDPLYQKANSSLTPVHLDFKARVANRDLFRELYDEAAKNADTGGRPFGYVKTRNGLALRGDDFQAIKSLLDDKIRQAAQTGESSLRDLTALKKDLIGYMRENVPKYAEAMDKYKELSRPIDQAKYGKYFSEKLGNSLSQASATEKVSTFLNALDKAQEEVPGMISKTTGLPRFSKLSDVLTPKQLMALDEVKESLLREAQSEAKAKGNISDTLKHKDIPKIGWLGPKGWLLNMSVKMVNALRDNSVIEQLSALRDNPAQLVEKLKEVADVSHKEAQAAVRNKAFVDYLSSHTGSKVPSVRRAVYKANQEMNNDEQ